MENENLVLGKIKEYLFKEISCLKKQENGYNEASKIDHTKDIRAELECLQDIIKCWEGI